LLRTIPGIEPINALTLLVETGDLRCFHHRRQFLKFCGMDMAIVQSGMLYDHSNFYKYGNASLRRHCGWQGRQQS
jgi:transposase